MNSVSGGSDESGLKTAASQVNRLGPFLLTGGSGLLGRVLRQLDATLIAPTRAELDVTDRGQVDEIIARLKPGVVLHAAAFTRNVEIRRDPERAARVNIAGTAHVAAACIAHGARLVYVSSDYVYADTPGPHREDEPLLPLNLYAWSKLGGECAARMVPDHLIIRTSFGPAPYEYERAAADKVTCRQLVRDAAPRILAMAGSDLAGVVNLGDEPKSMLAYARRTRPDVVATSLEEIGEPIPVDSSLSLERWRKWLAQSGNGER